MVIFFVIIIVIVVLLAIVIVIDVYHPDQPAGPDRVAGPAGHILTLKTARDDH